MGQHDSSYHLFFSNARMIRDLLHEILGEAWVSLLDLASAERVPSSFTSRGHKKRESDVIWKLRRSMSMSCSNSSPDLTVTCWMENVIFPRLGLPSDEVPGRLSLEGVETMLAERIDEWNRKLAEESRQEGRKEGEAHALLRLLEKKFGALPKGAQRRIAGAELALLLEWFDRAVTAERLEDVFAH